jgi:hypothetical protein
MIRTQSFLPKLHNGSPSNSKKGKKTNKEENIVATASSTTHNRSTSTMRSCHRPGLKDIYDQLASKDGIRSCHPEAEILALHQLPR